MSWRDIALPRRSKGRERLRSNPDNLQIVSQRAFDDDYGDVAEKKERMKNVNLLSQSANEKVVGDWLNKSMDKCCSKRSRNVSELLLTILRETALISTWVEPIQVHRSSASRP